MHYLLIIFQNILDPNEAEFRTDGHQQFLKLLEWKIRNINIKDENTESSLVSTSHLIILTELYQLAALVYLERCARHVSCKSTKVDHLVDRGYQLLGELGQCNWPFILLIFGAEAHTEDRRLEILRLASEAEGGADARNLHYARRVSEFMWTQDDLGGESVIYFHKMQRVLASFPTVPTFV